MKVQIVEMGNAVVTFTNRGLSRILAEGGSQAWSLNPERAAARDYLVCVQNHPTEDLDWGQPTHKHRHAFLVGKLSAVEPSPEGRRHRYIIRITEYAEIDIPVEIMHRNPVAYSSLDRLGIDEDNLKWKPVPTAKEHPCAKVSTAAPADNDAKGMNIASAKKALAEFYGVSEDAIEIVIRG